MSQQEDEKISIIDSPEISLSKIPAQQLAILSFNFPSGNKAFKKTISEFINLTKEDELQYWLIHCSVDCFLSTENHHWAANEIVPQIARELNLQKIALVESEDIFDRINLISLCEMLSRIAPVEIQFFAQEMNARKWIKEDLNLDFDS